MCDLNTLKSDATDPTNRGLLGALSDAYCTDREAQRLGALLQLQLQIRVFSSVCPKSVQNESMVFYQIHPSGISVFVYLTTYWP